MSENPLIPTLNEQPLSHRVHEAIMEQQTVASLLRSAVIWEGRGYGDDDLYVDREACLRWAREDRETAAALQEAANAGR